MVKEKEVKKVIKPEYYTVRLEVMAPIELTYSILADSPEKAIEKVEKNIVAGLSSTPKPILGKHRKTKVTIYKKGTVNIVGQKSY